MERVLGCVFFATFYCAWGVASGDTPVSDLDRKLKAIERQLDELEPDRAKLESECLKLLDQYVSPQDKGKIYAELVMVYSKKGMSDPDKMIEATLAHIDAKRAALGLEEYDPAKFGRSGDTKMLELEELLLAEKRKAIYGVAAD